MKKKVAFVLYRQWAYAIYKNIALFKKIYPEFEIPLLITTATAEFDPNEIDMSIDVHTVDGKDHKQILSLLKRYEIDAVFYYGWSWFVRDPIISKYLCLCLHPSPLPRYRGGSPIQHQIIAGETQSAVSVFRIGTGIDDGDIYKQIPMSLEGSLNDIFSRMINIGTDITRSLIKDLVDNRLVFTPQKQLEDHPPHKRRTKEEGQINHEEVEKFSYRDVYNLVRALTDPYPNAHILLEKQMILVQEVSYTKNVVENCCILNDVSSLPNDSNPTVLLRLSDGYAHVTKYVVIER